MTHIEITPDMLAAFGNAWEVENRRQASPTAHAEPGDRRRAGLAEVMKLVERGYHVYPKGYRPEGTELDLDKILDNEGYPPPPVVVELVHAVRRLVEREPVQYVTERQMDSSEVDAWLCLIDHLLERLGIERGQPFEFPAEVFARERLTLHIHQGDLIRDLMVIRMQELDPKACATCGSTNHATDEEDCS